MNQVNFIVLLPAATLCLLLMLHSLKTRGLLVTMSYAFMGAIIFTLREHVLATDTYEFQVDALTIHGFSIVAIVGWYFTTYTSLITAETLLRKYKPKSYGRVFPTVVVASMVTATISLMVEAGGQAAGWWHFNPEVVKNDGLGFMVEGAFMVPHGWAFTTTMMVLALLINQRGSVQINPACLRAKLSSLTHIARSTAGWFWLFLRQSLTYLVVVAVSIVVIALTAQFLPLVGFYFPFLLFCFLPPMANLCYRTSSI